MVSFRLRCFPSPWVIDLSGEESAAIADVPSLSEG